MPQMPQMAQMDEPWPLISSSWPLISSWKAAHVLSWQAAHVLSCEHEEGGARRWRQAKEKSGAHGPTGTAASTCVCRGPVHAQAQLGRSAVKGGGRGVRTRNKHTLPFNGSAQRAPQAPTQSEHSQGMALWVSSRVRVLGIAWRRPRLACSRLLGLSCSPAAADQNSEASRSFWKDPRRKILSC